MDDTSSIREKLMSLWASFDKGKLTNQEARSHIGFARAVLDSLKVEIAAAHLNARSQDIPPVPVTKKMASLVVSKKKVA